MRRLAGLFLIGVFALVVVACGDDDDDDDGAGDAASTATASATTDDSGDDAGDDSSDDAGDDAGDDSGGDDGGDVSDFAALLGNVDETEFRVTYDMTTTAAGEALDGQMTWYHSPDGRSRFDIDATSEGQPFQMISIVTPEASYLCTGLFGSDACYEFTQDSALPLPDLGSMITSGVDDFEESAEFGDVTTETIAGVDATCVSYDEPDGSGQVCVSESGLLLRGHFVDADGDVLIEAVEAADEVSDADFEPPYPISTFPGSAVIGRGEAAA